VEIEIEESGEKIILPLKALNLLGEILKAMSQGKPISIVPIATEVTTQRAAEILGCSRPYLVKLLEEGKIEYTKVGKHRRIKYEDVIDYKKKMKEEQKKRLIEIIHADEDLGLYDS
jgi:excisionase family DNA binding protein